MCKSDSSPQIIPIAIAIVEDQDRFLIGQRPAGAPLAGLWEFPGGKVESGEDVKQAARRECREECGLDVHVIGHYPGTVHTYEHARVQLSFLRCRPSSPGRTPREPFVWVARDDLRKYEFPAGNAHLLQLLLAGS